MKVQCIKSPVFSQGMNLINYILQNTKNKLTENSILAITSKIVSIAENRIVNKKTINKETLIKRECEYYLGKIGYECHLTIHHNLLIPSAGIDESNSVNGDYILYPKNPFLSAQNIENAIKQKLCLKNFGVIITDSRTLPLRKGVVGVALSYSGFKAVKNLIGEKDLFGRPLKMTTINIVDALASATVLLMGEGDKQCPLAMVYDVPLIFVNKTYPEELNIPIEEDIYNPLYSQLKKHN